MIQAAAKQLGPQGMIQFRADAGACEWINAEAGQDESDKLKKFSGTAYTGGAMKVGYGAPVVLDLAGITAGSEQIPFLKDHDPTQVVGHGEAEITGRAIKVKGEVSGVGPAAQEVTALAGRKFRWQLSVGVEPTKTEFVESGSTETVNGKKVSGPAYVVRSGQLREVSFVAIGADGRTTSSIAAHLGSGVMNFEQWVAAKGFDISAMTEQQVATLQAAFDAEHVSAEAKPVKVEPSIDAAAVAAKVDEIVAARIKAAQERELVLSQFRDRVEPAAFAKIAAATHADLNSLKVDLLQAARPTGPAVHVVDQSVSADVMSAALLRASGTISSQQIEKQFDAKTLEASDKPSLRAMTLHKLLGFVAAAGGIHVQPGDKDQLIRAAFEVERKRINASGLATFDAFSTISLSGILSNTANKALLAAYSAVNVTWNMIAAVRSHTDFKVNTLYQLDADGQFKETGASGELPLISLQESSYTNQLKTYGAVMTLTRRDMVNDSLGAFLRLPAEMGRLAALRIELAVYAAILAGINNTKLFHANNNNYLTSSGALAIGSLGNLAAKFDNQVDPNGQPILLSPAKLLVGTAIKTTAMTLYNESVVIGTTTTDKPIPARNPLAGLYEPVVSPYINNTLIKNVDGTAISGQTSTGFGLFARPEDRAAIGVAFLNGQQAPTVETGEPDFNQLGMGFRAYSDFGVGYEDPRAAAWATGT